MLTNEEILSFILDNIRKVMSAEELVAIDTSVSRLEALALVLTRRKPDIMMSELSQHLAVPMSTATGIVDRLVKKKLMLRGSSLEDRRVVTVRISEEGETLVKKMEDLFNKHVERVKGILTEEEFSLLITIIKKVAAGMTRPEATVHEPPELRRQITIE
ncbi:MAG: transcriptional regulator [Firmicutes bacterium]|nr:transcriptional regulator [Bacillota bacterium]